MQGSIGIILMVALAAVAAFIVGTVWFGISDSLLLEPALFSGTMAAYSIGGNDSAQDIAIFFREGDTLSFQGTQQGMPASIILTRPDGNTAEIRYGNGTEEFRPGDTLYISRQSRQNATYLLTKEQPSTDVALENGTWKLTMIDAALKVPLISATIEVTGEPGEDEPVPQINGFSVESWVRWNKNPTPASNNENWATIVVKGDTNDNRQYHLEHDIDNSRFEFVAATNATGDKVVFSSTQPQKDVWYHVVGIYDQTDGTLAIYVNGNREASINIGTGGLRPSTGPYQVGGPDGISFYSTTHVRKFDGTISGLNTYGRRLTDNEISAHAAAGHP
ncbi:hypothetical protein JCM10550A_07750 [Methanogenium cariaci]